MIRSPTMKNVVMSQSSSQCRNKEGACERRPPVTKWPCPCTDHRCQELPCARARAHTRDINAEEQSGNECIDECHAVARKNFQSTCYALKRLPSSLYEKNKKEKQKKKQNGKTRKINGSLRKKEKKKKGDLSIDEATSPK